MRSHLRRYAPADSKVIAIGNGQLSLGTVARASLAWDWGSDGLLKEYAANTPVVGYDPATGIIRGTQVWPQVTNSLLQNRNLAATWTNNGATKDAVGVDGVANTAWTLTDTDDASQSITVTNNSLTNVGFWLIGKGDDSAVLSLTYTGGTGLTYTATLDTSTGIATEGDDAVADDIVVTDLGDWWGLTLAAANNTTGNTTLTLKTDVDGGSGTIIQDFPGIYLNTAAGLVVPIETGATAVTREGDDIDLTSIPFYNPAESTIVFKGTFELAGVNRSLLTFKNAAADGTENIDILILSNETVRARVIAGNVSQAQLTTSALSAGKFAVALGVKANDFGLSVNGAAVLTDTSGTMPSDLVSLVIGRSRVNTDYARLWIEDITYYPVRLSDAQLQALST
jgi:hypothetical protein